MSRKLLIEALGTTVEIDLEGLPDDDARAVRAAWRDATLPVAERATPPVVERANRDETPRPEPADRPTVVPVALLGRSAMLQNLSQQVTLAVLDHRRGDLFMLHAAGIAADDGRVVVLVGPSGRGKTTAARTLSSRFGYVSDEAVAIDDEGRVLPYRKPLSVIEQHGEPKAERSPSELGLRPLPDAALRLAAIVLLDRREDAAEAAWVETVEFGDALADLVPQCSYLTAMAAPLHTMAAHAAAIGGIRRVTYREASSLPAVIAAILAEPAPRTPPSVGHRSHHSRAGRQRDETEETSVPRYARTPFVDALDLADADRLALLHAAGDGTGVLHVLGGIAPAIWRAADGASLAELTTAVLAAHGPPDGDARALVADAVEELVRIGVLSQPA